MKVFFYAMVIFLLPSSIYGQGKWDDCLSPTGGTQFVFREYHENINKIVLSHFTGYELLRHQYGETFWAIELDTADLKNPSYTISHLKPSQRIWQSTVNLKDISVTKVSRQLDGEDYELIRGMFFEALNSVSATCSNLGIDGGTTIISDFSRSGKIWTVGIPSDDTKKERLVKICLQIGDLIVNKKRKSLKLSKKLKLEILNLTSDFKEFNTQKRSFWN